MARVLAKGDPWVALDYQPHSGTYRQREAGARLLERAGLDAAAERVVVTSGAQHAMAIVFSALTNPGDTVLTGELNYSGMKSLANFLHIRLRGLAMDEEGIRADALEAACATTDAKALYCMPTLQNPTAVVMSERRRQEIAAIAESYGLAVVEDDSYGFLLPEVKALSAYATTKKNFFYLTGTSKSLAPGLPSVAGRDGRSARRRDFGYDLHRVSGNRGDRHGVDRRRNGRSGDGVETRRGAQSPEARKKAFQEFRLSRPSREPSWVAHTPRALVRARLRMPGAHARCRHLASGRLRRGPLDQCACRTPLPRARAPSEPSGTSSRDARRDSRKPP
ncbi:MAG: PLP-dependent aminotransferase family protein [Acidobacteria bacterium]|nr:MAG: PLP-dependent aminotransferase family protein [Acidobacteriota bacterium]